MMTDQGATSIYKYLYQIIEKILPKLHKKRGSRLYKQRIWDWVTNVGLKCQFMRMVVYLQLVTRAEQYQDIFSSLLRIRTFAGIINRDIGKIALIYPDYSNLFRFSDNFELKNILHNLNCETFQTQKEYERNKNSPLLTSPWGVLRLQLCAMLNINIVGWGCMLKTIT